MAINIARRKFIADETGYVEGQNVTFEYRWAEGQRDRLPGLAADLVHRQVTVIAAIGGDAKALAAQAATSTIPIVFQIGSDPIKAGLVTNLNRPGANLTGVSLFVSTLDGKRLQLIHELVPQADEIAVLISPLVADADSRSTDLQDLARTMRLRLLRLIVKSEEDFDAAFATIAARKPGALFVFGSPFFDSRRDQIVAKGSPNGRGISIPSSYSYQQDMPTCPRTLRREIKLVGQSHDASPQNFSASGSVRCGLSLRIWACAGRGLSDAADYGDCSVRGGRPVGYPDAHRDGSNAGIPRPARRR
jgi:hypothetical protein